MALSMGIVGLPNVGKSTIFNALTSAGAQSANYPFCTIEPNIGVVSVPDPRLETIRQHIESEKILPATMEFVDIAGLVKGAAKGEGLGNQFLANIRETNAILAVVRCFDDDNVVHVDGSVDPLRDIEIIQLELIYADLETLAKRQRRAESQAKTGAREAKDLLGLIQRVIAHLEQGHPVRTAGLNDDQAAQLADLHLLTAKPALYCCNVAEGDLPSGNAYSEQVLALAVKEGAEAVLLCGKIEEELAAVEPADRQELLEGYGLEEPALNMLIRKAFTLLGLQSYFTAGPKEIRAWTIPIGATAPQAAGVIHTDFERGFIRAQIYSVADLEQHKSESAIKVAGKLRVEGKDYVMRDSDIVHFLFNV